MRSIKLRHGYRPDRALSAISEFLGLGDRPARGVCPRGRGSARNPVTAGCDPVRHAGRAGLENGRSSADSRCGSRGRSPCGRRRWTVDGHSPARCGFIIGCGPIYPIASRHGGSIRRSGGQRLQGLCRFPEGNARDQSGRSSTATEPRRGRASQYLAVGSCGPASVGSPGRGGRGRGHQREGCHGGRASPRSGAVLCDAAAARVDGASPDETGDRVGRGHPPGAGTPVGVGARSGRAGAHGEGAAGAAGRLPQGSPPRTASPGDRGDRRAVRAPGDGDELCRQPEGILRTCN